MHWSYIFLALSLQYRDGSILLNCANTKDNQPKIEYHDQFQVRKILRNLQNTCFISLAHRSHLGITIILLFCLFCIIAVAIFWWAESSWLHKFHVKMRSSEASSGGVLQLACPLNQSKFYMCWSCISHESTQKLCLRLTKLPFWRLLINVQHNARN